MPPPADPASVEVNVTTGTGMEIAWKDGHRSSYSFTYLRDACPCALCKEEREKQRRDPGDAPRSEGVLPMFRPPLRPTETEPVGRYAIRFTWNDGHQHGIFSWEYLREVCPCAECRARNFPPSKSADQPAPPRK